MLIPNYHTDSETNRLLFLLAEMKKPRKDMGGYIEHYFHDEDTIVLKLTNGVLKIDEKFFEKFDAYTDELFSKEIKKLAEGFICSTF